MNEIKVYSRHPSGQIQFIEITHENNILNFARFVHKNAEAYLRKQQIDIRFLLFNAELETPVSYKR